MQGRERHNTSKARHFLWCDTGRSCAILSGVAPEGPVPSSGVALEGPVPPSGVALEGPVPSSGVTCGTPSYQGSLEVDFSSGETRALRANTGTSRFPDS